MKVAQVRILVAGAGTGGHLFPGIAVVERLEGLTENLRVCFVTTGRPIEKTVLAERGFETVPIRASGVKGYSIIGKLRSLGLVITGIVESRRILKHFRPHLVLGMGGYASAPVVLAAWMMGIPRVIHEQNRIAGITNRFLGRFSDRVFVSFPDTRIPGAGERVRCSGYPVRREIREHMNIAGLPRADREDNRPMTILIAGGSQGAHSINRAVAEALDYLENPGDFMFIHQSGAGDETYNRWMYSKKQVKATVAAFFNDMADHYRKADLAICRAGAGTLAELAAAGLPAILVPYPHAADNHQEANARAMADAGGAEILMETDMNPRKLAGLMMHYRSHPEALDRMRENLLKYPGNDDAAGIIAHDILLLAGFLPEGGKTGLDKNV